jgi:hypothetical protein
LTRAGGGEPIALLITRRYNNLLDQVRALLGAPATAEAEAAAPAPVKGAALAASREIGTAAKAEAGRTELRAELA